MKFSKSAALVAALAMATTGALAVSQHEVKAATIATTTTSGPARLYTSTGSMIKNRALAPNTPWLVGKTITIDGSKLYQVATNEYLRATDSKLSNSQSQQSTKKIIGHVDGIEFIFLVNDQVNGIDGNIIYPNSSWVIGKHIVNKYGQHYVQISSHEYAETSHMSFNSALPEPQYIANFDVYGSDINDPDDNNSNNESNKQVNNYKPNLSNINDYFVKYLNALHAANGSDPVQSSADMINYAQQRASQQTNGLDHSTAERNTSENLSSGGFNYMLNYGDVHSDKDAAYFLLKEWYDEDNNGDGIGSVGHFGHRAALIYSGPNVGLGITDGAASFDADWNYGSLDAFHRVYDFTGTDPHTNFISKDAVQ